MSIALRFLHATVTGYSNNHQESTNAVNIHINPATPADVPTLASLALAVHQVHRDANPARYKPIDPADPALRAWYADWLAQPGAHAEIALADGAPVGYLLGVLRQTGDNPFVTSVREFHINQMSVEPEMRGRGVGGLLVERALAAARAGDAEIVTLGVAAFNAGAVRFYQRYGFTVAHHSMSRTP